MDPEAQQNDPAKTGGSSAQGPQVAGGSQVLGGATSSGTPGASNSSAPAAKGPTGSDTFQNLNSYIDANQGNGFGSQFSGDVNKDVNAASTAQSQAADQFKSASDQATVKADPNVISTALNDPYSYVQDPNNVTAFQNQLNANYTGPSTLQDSGSAYQQAAGATQKAQDTAQNAQTEQGRFALLDQYFGQPNYSQGQKSLDNLLVQNDPTAQQGIQQAAQNAQGQEQAFQKEQTDLSNYAAQNRGTTEATSNAARAALGVDANGNPLTFASGTTPTGAIPTLQNQLNTTVTNDQTQLASLQTDINKALAAGDLTTLSPAEQAMLGITAPVANGPSVQGGQYAHAGFIQNPSSAPLTPGDIALAGVDPSKYLTYNATPTSFNTNSVATVDQANRLNALGQLAGMTGNLVNPTLAGTAAPATGLASFNLQGLLGEAKNAADAKFQQSLQNVPGITGMGAEGKDSNANYAVGTALDDLQGAGYSVGSMPANATLAQQQQQVTNAINQLSQYFKDAQSGAFHDPQAGSFHILPNQYDMQALQNAMDLINKQIAQQQTQFNAANDNFKY